VVSQFYFNNGIGTDIAVHTTSSQCLHQKVALASA
jgi:hypothetical protein